ncbi:unnamed protein product [Clavelina lepadiformis]|uniref:Uncharacterized protein n=1 Tax=Clavelina lepadiformis TaxID=159417 RepID=A0ABP0GGQ5_CLALP
MANFLNPWKSGNFSCGYEELMVLDSVVWIVQGTDLACFEKVVCLETDFEIAIELESLTDSEKLLQSEI